MENNINDFNTLDVNVLASLFSIAKYMNVELEIDNERLIKEVTSKFDKDRNLFIINVDKNIVENIYTLRLLFYLGYKFEDNIKPNLIMDMFKDDRGGYKFTTADDDIPSIIPTFLGLEMLLEIGNLK